MMNRAGKMRRMNRMSGASGTEERPRLSRLAGGGPRSQLRERLRQRGNRINGINSFPTIPQIFRGVILKSARPRDCFP